MARTKRAQILMESSEYDQLEEIARQKGVSVAELIRQAIKQRYFLNDIDRRVALKEITAMHLPVDDWENMVRDIEIGHNAELS